MPNLLSVRIDPSLFFPPPTGQLQARKWENAMTIDKRAWAFRRDADLADFLTTRELIEALVTTVSCGGF